MSENYMTNAWFVSIECDCLSISKVGYERVPPNACKRTQRGIKKTKKSPLPKTYSSHYSNNLGRHETHFHELVSWPWSCPTYEWTDRSCHNFCKNFLSCDIFAERTKYRGPMDRQEIDRGPEEAKRHEITLTLGLEIVCWNRHVNRAIRVETYSNE